MTTATPPSVQTQFETREQQQEAAILGIWIFLVTELILFGGLFTAYILYRFQYAAAFTAGISHSNVTLGGLNTLILLSSSGFLVAALKNIGRNKSRGAFAFVLAAILLGCAFVGIKFAEYAHKFESHLVPGSQFVPDFPGAGYELFFSLYFAATGLHLLHLLAGIGVLAFTAVSLARKKFSADYFTPLKGAALYWHFVDAVWIYLFSLFYLRGIPSFFLAGAQTALLIILGLRFKKKQALPWLFVLMGILWFLLLAGVTLVDLLARSF